MRFAQYGSYGPAEVLDIVEAPDPIPEGQEILLGIRAAGINPFDVKQRAGVYSGAPLARPQRTGFDGAGVIVAVGPDVVDWSAGDAVVTSGALGTAGTHLLVKPGNLFAVPAAIDFDRAAAIGVPVGTAYQSLRSLGVGPGDVLLVHGGSGAVGQAAVQFGLALGAAKVVATASEANLERLTELGAAAVAYGPGVLDRVVAAAGGAVTVVFDAAGTDDAFASADLLADRARWATIVAGRRADELGLIAFSGGSAVPLTDEQHALRREGIREGLRMIAEGGLDVEIAAGYPLDSIVDAHRAVERHLLRGKFLVHP